MRIFSYLIALFFVVSIEAKSENTEGGLLECPRVPISECCSRLWSERCPQPQCAKQVNRKCPERKALIQYALHARDLRRAPQKGETSKCGTPETGYHPCTSKSVANKLFLSCCELYVPPECHFMCEYECDQDKTKLMLTKMAGENKCSFKHLSSILYCASQNRNNTKCCSDLDLNSSQLMVGSRCLRMCDPSGTAIDKITKEDITCLYNWNVIMYCAHSGITEM
ncbi:hypothetical protein FO519_004099 [Halicephalobus sp. NKZ332]|nr:hypothetical protein FO519_004099 [Halicephalobus sp. NKZ332]